MRKRTTASKIILTVLPTPVDCAVCIGVGPDYEKTTGRTVFTAQVGSKGTAEPVCRPCLQRMIEIERSKL